MRFHAVQIGEGLFEVPVFIPKIVYRAFHHRESNLLFEFPDLFADFLFERPGLLDEFADVFPQPEAIFFEILPLFSRKIIKSLGRCGLSVDHRDDVHSRRAHLNRKPGLLRAFFKSGELFALARLRSLDKLLPPFFVGFVLKCFRDERLKFGDERFHVAPEGALDARRKLQPDGFVRIRKIVNEDNRFRNGEILPPRAGNRTCTWCTCPCRTAPPHRG